MRSMDVWVRRTMARSVSNTVVLKHNYITWPSQTPSDLIAKAAHDLIKALQGNVNHEGRIQMEDLKWLGDIFQDIARVEQGMNSPSKAQEPRVRIPRPSSTSMYVPRVETERAPQMEPAREEVPRPRVEEESTPQSVRRFSSSPSCIDLSRPFG
ncbi:hypothetical protein ACHAWF_002692 [Thalassiosira exigua]